MAKKREARDAGLSYARLLVPQGVDRLTVRDGDLEERYRVTSAKAPSPLVEELAGTVVVRPRRKLFFGNPVAVELSPELPWEVAIEGGVSHLALELDRVVLRALDIGGGASDLRLALSRPDGTCTLRIEGGVSDLSLRRPPGVGVRLEIDGGASSLSLDQFYFGAVGGKVRWESTDYRDARNRYDVAIRGGASGIRFET